MVLPNIKGISEKIVRVLRRENVKVGYKPIKTLNHSFPRPKDNNEKKDTRDVVYKTNCLSCDFVYYGQTGRAIKTRISEHKRAVRTFDLNSKIAQHVHKHDRTFDFHIVEIVDRTTYCHKRLFLEAWYSLRDSNAGLIIVLTFLVFAPLFAN